MTNNREENKMFSLLSESSAKRISEILRKEVRILLLTHKNPDGDAIGSALGLARVLVSHGLRVKVFIPDEAPDFLKWMPGYSDVGVFERNAKDFPGPDDSPDLVFYLDFNNIDRIGKMAAAAGKLNSPTVLIDHHPNTDIECDFRLVDTSRGSTAELVFLFLEQIGMARFIDKEAATCLYTGIITDTLGLQVSSSYPDVFRITGQLVGSGVDIEEVHNNVYKQFSENRMRLLGYCLAEKMTIIPEIGVAYIWLTREEMAKFKHIKGDTEGFVNYPLSISEVKVSVLFTELEDEIKLSLRSRGSVPVNKFAASHFSGGGHRNAAGGRSNQSMEESLKKFEKEIRVFMKNLFVILFILMFAACNQSKKTGENGT